jgi:hypothetical protein
LHLLHWLFEETKIGGWVAGICAAIGGYIAFTSNPVMVDADICRYMSSPCTQKTLDVEVLVGNLLFAAAAGAIGVGIALLAVEFGVDKDKLGMGE